LIFHTLFIPILTFIGPPEKEKYFNKIEEEGLPIHHDRQGGNRKAYMNVHENWERAEVCRYWI